MAMWKRPLAGLMLAVGLVVAPLATATPAAGQFGPDGLLPVPSLARVVDQPAVLTASERAALEGRLASFESDNGAQVAIVIVASTGIEPIEDFANRVGSAWKIGRHAVGDGLLLVVATSDRHARIEVARSLEGAIPDAVAKQVIQQDMAPRFRAGQFAAGLNAALDDLLPRIETEHLGVQSPTRSPVRHLPAGQSALHVLFVLIAVGAFVGAGLRRSFGPAGSLLAGVGAGAIGGLILASVALGLFAGVLATVFGFVFGSAGRYGHAVGGPGGIYFPPSWGGGGGFGGGGFSSGGGGDFSGGGASGSW